MHHFAIDILDNNNTAKWRAIGIYGWPEQADRHLTWSLMSNLRAECDLPCIMFGDFNEIISLSKKEGGVPRSERLMDPFRSTMDTCSLHDLGFKGSIFTWERGNTMETFVRERLDRFLASEERCLLFSDFEVTNMPIFKVNSDHAPIIMSIVKKGPDSYSGNAFKFESLWLSNENCGSVIENGWSKGAGLSIMHRLAVYSEALASWAALTFGSVKKRIKIVEKKIRELKMGSMDGGKLERVDLERLISAYFENLFATSSPTGFQDALERIESVVMEDMNAVLDCEPTDEEIKSALFQIHPNKAPRPYGMHALFFQKFWQSVGPDIIAFVKSWWRGDVDLRDMNKTCIVLILKCTSPLQISESRHISCCNVIYKIVSKTMANKLKGFLDKVISPNQSAFIPGRLIFDNALVAFENFHSIECGGEGKKGSIAMKLDMIKAYDRVEWVFLEKVMDRMGFSSAWIGRIMSCLQSVNFASKLKGKSRVVDLMILMMTQPNLFTD
ncbi:uncharacterized protein LOC110734917 [Chenopodium quinoa]|uniref:uncharacterized protein LOC110734917 n=1 Tax=Chenopodium quinoa TaxID=63459 RepID=UPI000B7982F2|nr:uncharacterized protein LOC110734917 [Chenopodium quinoa]